MPDETNVFKFNLPIPCGDRGIWGALLNENWALADKLISLNRKRTESWHLAYMAASGLYFPFGFEDLILSGAALTAGPPVAVSVGTSHISVDVKAGVDLIGVLTLTGDSRHPSTGDVTLGDTETIAIAGAGRYTSLKTWVGSVDLSTTDLDISDLDAYSTSLFQNAGQPYELESVQLLGMSSASGLSLTTVVKRYQKVAGGFVVSDLIPTGKLDIASTPAGDKHWDLTYSVGLPLIQSDRGEGVLASLSLTGSPGEWKDLRLALNYKIRPNAA